LNIGFSRNNVYHAVNMSQIYVKDGISGADVGNCSGR